MENNRWILNRAGFVNFWYYSEEEFNFIDGKLLLRGSNGSGKSVTMQSLIPLLLDGNRSPSRLDPFGSNARKIENYLLSEDNPDTKERTAYIYLEFKKENKDTYITIGMGFKAERNKQLQTWYFAITDNRRIGFDFYLYKKGKERIPLSKRELKNKLEEGGELLEKQKEYMALVNRLLFGYDSTEEYDELIKLLIHIRTPKLSKDFKPTVVYEIMNNSLQPLSEEDLRPMSEAIENMDNIQSRLNMLMECSKSANKLKDAFHNYNKMIIYEDSVQFINSYEKLQKLKGQHGETLLTLEEIENSYKDCERNYNDLLAKEKAANDALLELQSHDILKLQKKIGGIAKEIKEVTDEKALKEERLQENQEKELNIRTELKDVQNKIEEETMKIYKLLEEMDEFSQESDFKEQIYFKEELKNKINESYDFSYVRSKVKGFLRTLREVKINLQKANELQEKYNVLDLELSRKNLEKKDLDEKYNQAEILFTEIKEEYIDELYTWEEKNKEFKIKKDNLSDISRIVNAYGEKYSFEDIKSKINDEYLKCKEQLLHEKSLIKSEKEKKEEEKNQIQSEIEHWENMKEPEPERSNEVSQNRVWLEENKIPYISFYKAIDFVEGISEEKKSRIEEALLKMNLLDGLIVPYKYVDKALNSPKGTSDIYITPKDIQYENSLMKYMKPSLEKKSIEGEYIEKILKSISIGNIDTNNDFIGVEENDNFKISILRGGLSETYEASFIGISSRERYRESKIKSLKDKLYICINELRASEDQFNTIIEREGVLNKEYKSLPNEDNISTAYNEVLDLRNNLEKVEQLIIDIEGQLSNIFNDIKKIKLHIKEKTSKIDISVELSSYENALEAMEEYEEHLANIISFHNDIVKYNERTQGKKESLDEILDKIDEYIYEINKQELKLKEKKELLNQLQGQLDIQGVEEILQKINEYSSIVEELPIKIRERYGKMESLKKEEENKNEKLQDIKENIENIERVYVLHRESAANDLNFKYVLKEESLLEEEYIKSLESNSSKNDFSMDLITRIKKDDKVLYKLSKKVRSLLNAFSKSIDNTKIMDALNQRFNEAYMNLKEYNLRKIYVDRAKTFQEEERVNTRIDIKAKIRGIDIGLYELVHFIQDAIEQNEKLLSESDRELFQDILAKNISKKIRAKIYHGKRWVSKMNELMESMDTSSGLSLSLKWENNKSYSEEQLGTKELVELLNKDANLLRDEDLEKISMHFKSKIEEARRISKSGEAKTYHSAIKEVLDYRKWYEFKLHFRKGDTRKKELTNNAFFQFSGGEKAMAMYVPLFSAVYARYEAARKDSPRIISLDEAFAGVDENNITDMFRLLEDLRLSYVLNSQILWGDYETVPSLAISELVRPNNEDIVTVIRYEWNGKEKEVVGI